MKDWIIIVSSIVSVIVSLGMFRLRCWLIERSIFKWLDNAIMLEITLPEWIIKEMENKEASADRSPTLKDIDSGNG